VEPAPIHIDTNMIVATSVLAIAYALIFTDVIHRTSAAIIGSVVMVGVGMWMGFYTQEDALTAIDGNTILLLLAMMIVVALLRPTGVFEFVAIRITKLTGGNSKLLLLYLTFAVSVISTILDNVTTVIVFAPLTILITRILHLNPMPYLMAEAMLSNVGGIATLVGDPPNIIIGSAAGIDFTRFLVHMGPPIALVWIVTTGLILFLFRKELPEGDGATLIDLDESQAITDAAGLKRMLVVIGVIILLFFVHHRLHVYPAFVALIGLALALALLRPKPELLLSEVNWSVLVFFAGLFVIVGGVESSGLFDLIGDSVAGMAQDPAALLITALSLMWIAAIMSAIVDNIPFTVAMVPIILGLESQNVNVTPLWWALAIGVGLGGNGTHIGATANVVVVAVSEECGIPDARISPRKWLRTGLPIMFVSLIAASLVYAVFFDFFL
jgi:Na+/H+ antiporter NhaD/arsenite permease-like protein